jgi:xylulokinase
VSVAPLVAGVDSSTQSCSVVVRDAETGRLVRRGSAPHPDGTEIDPEHWWDALVAAVDDAGGLEGVQALSVAAQQHGLLCLDDSGGVIRPALLWNDVRSAGAAADLVGELGGPQAWADAVGTVPVASFTVAKLRWLAEHEPENAERVAAVCLPHDWLTWQLQTRSLQTDHRTGGRELDTLSTDRGDASGTGYWSPATGAYRRDLVSLAWGRDGQSLVLPRVLGPAEPAGLGADGVGGRGHGVRLGPGTGDNAAAALGLHAGPGDVVVSVGTSGVVSAVSEVAPADPSGLVAGFADATGRHLPLACTLNAARVLDATAAMLGTDHAGLDRLALQAPPGCDGLVMVPYLEGERTPNRPDATGAVHGLRLANSTPAHLARAAVEGVLCGLADALDALVAAGAQVERILLVGGGARSEAVRRLAPAVLGRPVVVPPAGEYVADGAARQAAWVLAEGGAAPTWSGALAGAVVVEAGPAPAVRHRYAEARELLLARR